MNQGPLLPCILDEPYPCVNPNEVFVSAQDKQTQTEDILKGTVPMTSDPDPEWSLILSGHLEKAERLRMFNSEAAKNVMILVDKKLDILVNAAEGKWEGDRILQKLIESNLL